MLDALGRGINDLEAPLAKMNEGQEPSKVVFAVITDGQQNASREFTKDQIVKMIKDRTEADKWPFVFLSADLEAINDAVSYGIRPDAVLAFKSTGKGTTEGWASLSSTTSAYRSGRRKKIGFDLGDGKDKKDPTH